MAEKRIIALYSDLNPYTPTKRPLLYNIEAIRQSIMNILSTVPSERLFNRDFGCDLEGINFELLDFVTIELATYVIYNAIETYEPRVRISNNSKIIPDYDNHVLDMFLIFEVTGFTGQSFSLGASLSR